MLPQQSAGVRPQLDRAQRIALIVGIVAAIIGVVGMLITGQYQQFLQSYLWAFIFWFGLALGGLAITMLQHLVGGAWGASIRRVVEANAMTLPFVGLLFIPVLIGMWTGLIYPWRHAEFVLAEPTVAAKSFYLEPYFFTARTIGYFAIWIGLARTLNRWSLAQDRTHDESLAPRMRMLSGPGIVLYFLTVTLAAVDWTMSLEPTWYSSMYGVIYLIGQGVSTWAFTIIVLHLLREQQPVKTVMTRQRFQDIGNLLFAFCILWAYINFSQYLIIWAGNIAETTTFYVARSSNGWQFYALALMLCQFFIPFFVLMVRFVKRTSNILVRVAMFVILIRFVDLYWLIKPAFHPEGVQIDWTDFVTPFAIGGLWLAGFFQFLKTRPLVPEYAPVLLRRLKLEQHEDEKHEELFGHLHH